MLSRRPDPQSLALPHDLSPEARRALADAVKSIPVRTEKLPRRLDAAAEKHLLVSAPSLADLQGLLAKTNAAIAERRVEELKVLADGYAKKLQMNGCAIKEGIEALKPYLPALSPGRQV